MTESPLRTAFGLVLGTAFDFRTGWNLWVFTKAVLALFACLLSVDLSKAEERRRCWAHLARGAARVHHLCPFLGAPGLSGAVTRDCPGKEAEV